MDYRPFEVLLVLHAGPDEAITGNLFHIRSACVRGVSWTVDGRNALLDVVVISKEDPLGVVARLNGYVLNYASFWFVEKRTHVHLDLLMPDVEPGNYTLKVLVYAYTVGPLEGAKMFTKEFTENITLVKRVTPHVTIAGPEKVRPGDVAKFLITFTAEGEPQDPMAITVELLSPHGAPVATAEVTRVSLGTYVAELNVPVDIELGPYVVMISAWKEGLVVFNCTAARELVVISPLETELTRLVPYVALALAAAAVAAGISLRRTRAACQRREGSFSGSSVR